MTSQAARTKAVEVLEAARYATMAPGEPPNTPHDKGTPVVVGWETLIEGMASAIDQRTPPVQQIDASAVTAVAIAFPLGYTGAAPFVSDPEAITVPGIVPPLADEPNVLEAENQVLRRRVGELETAVNDWKQQGNAGVLREKLDLATRQLSEAQDEVVRLRAVVGRLSRG